VGKRSKDKNTAISGMPRGTANARLRKKVLFELLRSVECNICYHCGKTIPISEDLALEHVEDWKDDDDLFWKLSNIAFSHLDCSSGAARQEDKRMLVDVTVENEHGEELPTFHHKGMIYTAGRKGERYNLRITNRTSERLEIVVTVDGRDVISGEKGDITNTGYVIRPFDNTLIKGFRQNHGNVAAFRFSSRGASYSSRSGTVENVGVIGVAIFREKPETPPQWICNLPPIVVNPPPVYYSSTSLRSTCKNLDFDEDVDVTVGASAATAYDADVTVGASAATAYNISNCDARGLTGSPGVPGGASHTIRKAKSVQTQDLGTKYGESISDSCSTTSFYRLANKPEEVWQIWYDTMSALRKKGVPTHKVRKQANAPNPFPNTPYVAPGFAKPPR
jgi:hypothetical protein